MEKWINFKIISKNDERLYLKGTWDITNYNPEEDDTGDWEYEGNDGLMNQQMPRHWTSDNEDLTDAFEEFLGKLDWFTIEQFLWDFQQEMKTVEFPEYTLEMNSELE